MKKILAVLLALAMLLGFAACGGNNEDTTTTTAADEATTVADEATTVADEATTAADEATTAADEATTAADEATTVADEATTAAPAPAGDQETVPVHPDHGTRPFACLFFRQAGLPDLQSFINKLCVGAGPGVHSPDQPLDGRGAQTPVDPARFFGQHGGIGRPGMVLGLPDGPSFFYLP